jgi:hypothetical protein
MRTTPRVAGFRSEYPAGFELECMAGFVGIRIQAMDTLFMRWFEGESWDAWRVILKAAFALPVTKDEVAFFRTLAGDRDPPKKQVKGCGLPRPPPLRSTAGR